jgi:hypothetical protein
MLGRSKGYLPPVRLFIFLKGRMQELEDWEWKGDYG